jgi:hypothetical protein
MVNVTGSKALLTPPPPPEPPSEWPVYLPDGGYKLTAAKGLVPKPDMFLSNTAGLLDSIEKRDKKDHGWLRLHRTQWSVADSEAKLMLAHAGDINGNLFAIAINEGIWTAFEAAFPGDMSVLFEWLDDDTPYRVLFNGEIVGYIARAQFPKDQQGVALGLAEMVAK